MCVSHIEKELTSGFTLFCRSKLGQKAIFDSWLIRTSIRNVYLRIKFVDIFEEFYFRGRSILKSSVGLESSIELFKSEKSTDFFRFIRVKTEKSGCQLKRC